MDISVGDLVEVHGWAEDGNEVWSAGKVSSIYDEGKSRRYQVIGEDSYWVEWIDENLIRPIA